MNHVNLYNYQMMNNNVLKILQLVVSPSHVVPNQNSPARCTGQNLGSVPTTPQPDFWSLNILGQNAKKVEN